MAITRVGFGGASAAYPGFTAKAPSVDAVVSDAAVTTLDARATRTLGTP